MRSMALELASIYWERTFVCMDVWCLVYDQKIDDMHVAKAGREGGREGCTCVHALVQLSVVVA